MTLVALSAEASTSSADRTPNNALMHRLMVYGIGSRHSAVKGRSVEPNGMLSSVVLIFPRITAAHFLGLDCVHDELKTHLIVKHELMFSPFHPRSIKPSVSNPEFPVFRAPFPMLAIRHMDVRDITFVGTNERAFKRYYAMFSRLFEAGGVSNEFGHVSGFIGACERFGFRVADGLSAAHADT